MSKKTSYELTSVSFRFASEQVRQLALLGMVYGGQTRALSVALDRLYRTTLAENAAFAELAAAGVQPDELDPDDEGRGD